MAIDHEEIKALIPHRYPMLLVDRIDHIEPGVKIIALKRVLSSDSCFTQPRSNRQNRLAYPNSLMIESMGQASAVLYSLSLKSRSQEASGIVLLGSITGFKFHHDVFPGDKMEHRVKISSLLSSAAVCEGSTWVGETLVAEAKRMLVLNRPSGELKKVS
ncbi:MAG: 3-hydroxyacyl-ACP dehydratase FabZ family protein [Cyanobacteria bacterium P01_H01_bin.105]